MLATPLLPVPVLLLLLTASISSVSVVSMGSAAPAAATVPLRLAPVAGARGDAVVAQDSGSTASTAMGLPLLTDSPATGFGLPRLADRVSI